MAKNQAVRVLYEDNHLLVVDKPAGVLVQGDVTGDVPLVDRCKAYIRDQYHKPGAVFLGVVHRLDRPVSGVVVFARTSKALERMNALFRNRKTKKIYWAIVDAKPPARSGQLEHWLVKDSRKNRTVAFARNPGHGKHALLNFELKRSAGHLHLLEVVPVTGRSHQIRVQLAAMGCPIVGDLKYGSGQSRPKADICLHARQLEFEHPVKKTILQLSAAPPHDPVWDLFR